MRAGQIVRHSAVVALVMLGAGPASESADTEARWSLTGGGYCRTAGELRCLGQLTEQKCARSCVEEMCYDWFWLARRPGWTWGYGGRARRTAGAGVEGPPGFGGSPRCPLPLLHR